MAAFDLALRFAQGNFTLELAVDVGAKVLALYGPSGSGKTTTLELIAGIRKPSAGRIRINSHTYFDSTDGTDVPIRSRRVGYVPQDVLLFPHMDVRTNIEYGWQGDRDRSRLLIELLDLEPLLARAVLSLSGGERQRVALARALNAAPQLLLLDEPLAAVDLPRRRRIVDALAAVRDQLAIPIIYVAHAQEEVRALADVALILDEGRVLASGSPASVLT